MSEQLTVRFAVADVDAEERLVREYVTDAVERLSARDDARWPTFNRYGHDPAVDRGEVVVTVFGDAAAIADDEQARWHELDDDGLALDVRAGTEDVRLADLDEMRRFRYRTRHAAARMSLAFLDEFDDLPDALDEFPDADYDVGWALCLHHVVNQLGYQAGDGEEEIDLLFDGLVGRLHATAAGPAGVDAAEAKIEELVAELESLPAELRRQHGERRS